MLSVFFSSCVFRVWFGVFCRFLPFFSSKGRFLEKFFGSELLFLGVGVGLVFFGGFLPMFLIYFWHFAPETVWKNSLDVRSCFSRACSLFLWFFCRRLFARCFFFLKRQRSGSNRTPPHTRLFCWFLSFLCPAAFVCFARFGRASRFLVVFSGCHSGLHAFLGFSLDLLRLFLGTRGGKGFPSLLVLDFCFSPFVLFCGHTFSRSPSRWSRRSGLKWVISPAPLPEWGLGGAPRGRRVGPLLVLYCFVSSVWFGSQGPQAHCAKSRFVRRGRLFELPPGLSHARFSPGLFLSFSLSLSQLNATTWRSMPPYTHHSSEFLLAEGGKCCPFFYGPCFCESPGLFWLFSSVLRVLAFFKSGFRRRLWTWGGLSGELALKIRVREGGNAVRFCRGRVFWSLSVPFRKSPRRSSCRRVRQKNLVFPGISCVCRVWGLWFSLLFCFECTFLCVVFLSRKTSLKVVFFADLALSGAALLPYLAVRFLNCMSGCGGWFSALKRCCFWARNPPVKA